LTAFADELERVKAVHGINRADGRHFATGLGAVDDRRAPPTSADTGAGAMGCSTTAVQRIQKA